MATTIKLKNGSGAPLAGDLVQGEPALDLTNKRLYTENASGTVIEVGTNPSTIDINAGTIDGTVIGGASAAAGTFTTFTSTGIDDNATSTAITIDSSQNVGIGTASPSSALHVSASNGDVARIAGTTRSLYFGADSGGVMLATGASQAGNGIYFNESSNLLYFQTASTERMRVDSSGNVGINTTSPATYAKFTVEGSGILSRSVANNVNCQISTLGSAGLIQSSTIAGSSVPTLFYNGGSETMRIDSSGSVGIGTASPNEKLVSNGAIRATGAATNIANADGALLDYAFGFARLTAGSAASSVGITFNTAVSGTPTERMRIDSSGNVGIGTSSPLFNVDVDDSDSNGTRIRVYNDARSGVANAVIGAYADDANGSRVAFGNNAFPTSQYNHNVSRPDSSRSAWAWSSYVLNSTYENQSAMTLQYVNASGTQTERMRIDSSGNLLVGTTSTAFRGNHTIASGSSFSTSIVQTQATAGASILNLDFSVATPNNATDYFIYAEDASAIRFVVYANGDVANVNNSYGAYSDKKLKENIVDATNKLEDLKQVKVRNYNLIGDDKKQIGVIAQELEAIFPSMVEETPDLDDDDNDLGTTTKSVKYSVFVPILIKAVQEQQVLIEQLQAEVAALKGA